MRSALAIRHVGFEDAGAFVPALDGAGYALRYWDAGDDTALLENVDPDLLIVLGGPIGADRDDLYPFLKTELGLIERRLAARKPVLGICLGAQLMARAAGATIRPAPAKEIGFAPISLSEAGALSCLAPFAHDPITLHWHGDTFDLPAGALRLASTDICENQAFSLGPHAIGFQFHPEAGGGSLEAWLVGHAVELAAAGVDIAQLRQDAGLYGPRLAKKGREVAASWLAELAVPA
ncbi:glutamine amidotransferase [Maricaulis sp.]|uniref:glutamine amidotransferase n=1 Tax=Maricaulis sp. TaxID=1486257 RepID=UPI00329821EA